MSVENKHRSDQKWRQVLTAKQFAVTRKGVTDAPFSGRYVHPQGTEGHYVCVCCNTPLFAAARQFDSGSGWPSFTQPVAPDNVAARVDNTLAIERTEILCAACDAHLGHVFPDGPPPTGQRYCINSTALHWLHDDGES